MKQGSLFDLSSKSLRPTADPDEKPTDPEPIPLQQVSKERLSALKQLSFEVKFKTNQHYGIHKTDTQENDSSL